ncbi:MAG: nucleotide exchange factor GrpE [Actinomycetia bacterium]|nr:nucleotide exchange factor GrpE [Actinomycetes bacterium]
MSGFPNDPTRPASGPDESGTGIPTQSDPESEVEGGVRFTDNRKLDPETLQARPQADQGPDAEVEGVSEDAEQPDTRIAELTADLQRVTAEYANYRKRVDRDRSVQAAVAKASVLTDLLPILDDLGRAQEHGELDGGFKAVGDAINGLAEKNGVEAFGVVGEPFDPNVHDAMTSDTSPEVTEPTVTMVYQVGYRVKDRILRHARVGVTDAE